jgi:hypothetical protein
MGFVFLFCSLTTFEFADGPNPYQANIDRGRAYLFDQLRNERRIGHLGLGVMALLKTAPVDVAGPNKGRPQRTPEVQQLVDRFAQEVDIRENEFRDQEGTYAIAVAVSCLIADDPVKHERIIRKLVARIIADQKPNGSWSYPSGAPQNGDTSQVQYIALALWDAARVGVKVPPRVWDSLLDWQIKTQDAAGRGGPGGFVYQPMRIPEDGKPVDQGSEIATMGVAGLSTLLICQSQLPGLKKAGGGKGGVPVDELVRPADNPDARPFIPKVAAETAMAAIVHAETWLGRNSVFQDPFKDLPKSNYFLYGYERVAALLKGAKSPLIAKDWYRAGGDFLARTQKADGSWSMGSHWTPTADTAFALLFLGRTTHSIDLFKVEVMPRARAVGGEGGLPNADAVAGGAAFQRQFERFRLKPVVGVEALIEQLNDPDKIVSEESLTRIESTTLKELKEMFERGWADAKKVRRWAYDKQTETRIIALTILAKSRQVRFAPILIDALNDKDSGVYTAARNGLRHLSRNVEVFGLPGHDERTEQNIKEGIDRANVWFRGLKVEVAAYQEFTPPQQ